MWETAGCRKKRLEEHKVQFINIENLLRKDL